LRRLRFVGGALLALPCGYVLDVLAGDGFSSREFGAFVAANAVIAVLVLFRTGLLLRAVKSAEGAASLAQSRFESVFRSAGLGISITTGGVMAQTNGAFQELVGYSGEELCRMRPSMIIHPADLSDVVEEGEIVTSASFERRYLHRDGSIVQTHVTMTSPRDEDFAIAVVENTTLRAALEEQLRDAQKMEAVGRLAGGVAHDFNNVLTVVSGHAELLREDVSSEQGQADITVILDAVRRASDLTRQLLAFSRVQELDPVILNPADVVRETELLLAHVIGKFVRLESSIDDAAPLVSADPVQLNQVLLNLAVNARDAMPDGGVLALRVDEWSAEQELEDRPGVVPGLYCRISVSDTGTGMDEATQARIFEPFFTTKGPGGGTGLGLATTYGIVKQSGGHIFVDSRLGHGTTFEILLPAAAGMSELPVLPVAA
jgi:PAS domain S-box-containing protein